jgi:hypothetical protein
MSIGVYILFMFFSLASAICFCKSTQQQMSQLVTPPFFAFFAVRTSFGSFDRTLANIFTDPLDPPCSLRRVSQAQIGRQQNDKFSLSVGIMFDKMRKKMVT